MTNNSLLDGVALDGMRKHLADDFDAIYILDLGGNVRKNPKLSGTTHNVFGIQVGVSINFLVKKRGKTGAPAKIFYARVERDWRKEEKYRYLDEMGQYGNVDWKRITPNKRHTWLTEGLHAEFVTFVPLGSKEAKAEKGEVTDVIFHKLSSGVLTARDAWVYNFNRQVLIENIGGMIDTYNEHVFKWERQTNRAISIDDFVNHDGTKTKWSETLKRHLKSGKIAGFEETRIRRSLYRPFTQSYLFFDRVMIDRVLLFPSIIPTPGMEAENRVICVTGLGSEKPFLALMANKIVDLNMVSPGAGGSQCFPYYTYDEDGSNRRENITDWALAQFRTQYDDETISKWDIFHYVYGLLHHPAYRERYQANLKRELPRIPFAPDFRAYADAGARLAAIHVGYEEQPQYPLQQVETPEMPLDWRVEKMRLSKDKTQLRYNGFLTLDGIPAETFAYRLGNRSALEWVIDQYRVKTDKRSGIVNDPNRADDPEYIVRLIGKVISVSLDTVAIVAGLPGLGIDVAEMKAGGGLEAP